MSWKEFYTLKEQGELRARGQYEEISRFCKIVTVTETQKTKLEIIRQAINEVRQKARSSKSKNENKAADLLSSVTRAMHDARSIRPGCRPSDALCFLNEQPFPTSLGSLSLSGCLDTCAEALLREDHQFFRALAAILKRPKFDCLGGKFVSLGSGFDPLIHHALNAYYELQQEGTIIPNKKQVAERAVHSCAKASVLARSKYRNSPYNWKERDDSEYPSVLSGAIQQESKKLRKKMEQKEARFWTNVGLKDLPRADKQTRKQSSRRET